MGFMKSSSRKERDTSARPFLPVTRWQARCYFKAGFQRAAAVPLGDATITRGSILARLSTDPFFRRSGGKRSWMELSRNEDNQIHRPNIAGVPVTKEQPT